MFQIYGKTILFFEIFFFVHVLCFPAMFLMIVRNALMFSAFFSDFFFLFSLLSFHPFSFLFFLLVITLLVVVLFDLSLDYGSFFEKFLLISILLFFMVKTFPIKGKFYRFFFCFFSHPYSLFLFHSHL